jgi:tetratricopeptide (TPR) repeat protein
LEESSGEAQALSALVRLARDEDPLEAIMVAKKALSLYKAAKDSSSVCAAQRTLAELLLRVGRFDAGLEAAERAVNVASQLSDPRSTVASVNMLTRAHLLRCEFDAAMDYAKEALPLSKSANWKRGEAEVLVLIAEIETAQSNFAEAIRSLSEAQQLMKDHGDADAECEVTQIIAETYFHQREFDEAEKCATALIELARRHGFSEKQVTGTVLVAASCANRWKDDALKDPGFHAKNESDYMKALSTVQKAVKLARQVRATRSIACAQVAMAELLLVGSDVEASLGASMEAVQLGIRSGDEWTAAKALQVQAIAHCLLKEMDEAWEAASDALNKFRYYGDQQSAEEVAEFLEKIYPHWQKKTEAPAVEAIKDVSTPAAAAPEHPGKAAMDNAVEKLGERTAMDLTSGATKELIVARLTNILEDVLSLDLDDFEQDTPMMQAGVTSQGAVLVQAALQIDFPSIKIPATLAFDYPSTGAVADFILATITK